MQRVSDLQGTSIGDISGYTGPIGDRPGAVIILLKLKQVGVLES